MCKKFFLLTFAIHKISCDEFYNFLKNNPDLKQSLLDLYEGDSGDLDQYEDLLEEESTKKYDEFVDDKSYLERAKEGAEERAEERTFEKESRG